MAGPARTRQVQPPRPPNAWILFRAEKSKEIGRTHDGASRPQSDVSKHVSEMWRTLDPAIKKQYELRAELKKEEHMRKYPGYRFAPVKKADREREREERATQGRTSRKTGSSSATTASSASPMTASTSATQLDPMMVSADPRYGPWGPSPPISAAASPEPGPWSDHQVDDQVQAAITSLPTPNTSQSPSSQTLFPPNNLPEQPSNSVPSLWQVTQQLPAPQSPITLPHTPTSMASWSNSNSFTMPDPVGSDSTELVSFDIGQIPGTSNWDSLTAFLSSTGDPSIFSMPGFNEDLLQQPSGEIQVSVGNYALPEDFNIDQQDFSNFSFDQPFHSSPASQGPDTPITPASFPHESGLELDFGTIWNQPQYNADDFINFDPYSDTSSSVDPVDGPSPTTHPTPYQPPSGAGYSGRRVAASWKSGFGGPIPASS